MKRRFCYCDAFLIYKTFKMSIQNEAETIKKQVKKQLRFWHRFFPILTPVSGRFWRTFWPLGRLLGALGRLLDTSWAYLGRSWASLGRFWASWAPLGRILGASWVIWVSILKGFKDGLGGFGVRSGPQNNMQPGHQCLQRAQFSSHLSFLTSSRQVASAGFAKRKQFLNRTKFKPTREGLQ